MSIAAVAAAIVVAGGLWYFMQSQTQTVSDLYSFAGVTKQAPADETTITPAATTSTASPTTSTTNQKIMQATLHTTKGDIVIEFNAATPNTVANFTKLAGEGFYSGTKFHRVISGFMIQGGDPLTRDDSMSARWGTGGPGYQFADEIAAGNRNEAGTIAMANSGPNTNGSQFFINVADNAFLDQKHTVFGKVVSGMEVVKAIETTPTAAGDRPVTPMVVTSIELK